MQTSPSSTQHIAAHGEGNPLTEDQILRSQESTLARLVATGFLLDSRGGIIIATNVALLGTLIATTSWSQYTRTGGALAWVLIGLAAVGCASSIGMAAAAALPRSTQSTRSIVFFGSIASVSADAYFTRVHAITRQEYARDLSDQCHFVATLVTFKFRWVRRSLVTLLLAAVPWLACLEMAGRFRPS